jgi:hypothetical protein
MLTAVVTAALVVVPAIVGLTVGPRWLIVLAAVFLPVALVSAVRWALLRRPSRPRRRDPRRR